jgi:adenosylcobyric acid synthase
MSRGLLVAGTHSDAGKSVITAGICRWLRRKGVRVAPFKAQNMSNNSVVTVSRGRAGEIGRAQALQAAACGLEPEVRFNPVLLKPGSDLTSQVVLLGEAVGQVGAGDFAQVRTRLAQTAFDTLADVRREYDVVVCEGAGSPAEINLREYDYVNLGLARHARLPVVVVGDIDRGGVFASLYGTLALLEPADQALVCGFLINKFRGDAGLLAPGLDALRALTGRPTLGVLPWRLDLWLDAEDSLAYGTTLGHPGPPLGTQWLRVAVIRLPHLSNATDAEALAVEPGVRVRLTVEAAEIDDADLLIVPGSKSTVDDLQWLRRTGLAEAVRRHAGLGKPLLGICGGFQMLGELIHDDVESGRGTVAGLGLLPVEVTFAARKTLARPVGSAYGAQVDGYEIHHGQVTKAPRELAPLFVRPDGTGEGAIRGSVFGTHWHGTFASDAFRRAFLTEAARLAGRSGFRVAPDTQLAGVREAMLDSLGDLIEANCDTEALWRLIENGPPPGQSTIPPAGSRGDDVRALARRVMEAEGRLRSVRLVLIDGPSGAGKTVFAGRLSEALREAGAHTQTVHTDDLLDGWDDQIRFFERLVTQVLEPLRRGEPGEYHRYDWVAGRFGAEAVPVHPDGVVIVEGVTAARAEVRAEASLTVFVTAPAPVCLERALARDGEQLRAHLERWQAIEAAFFAEDRTRQSVDLVIDTTDHA